MWIKSVLIVEKEEYPTSWEITQEMPDRFTFYSNWINEGTDPFRYSFDYLPYENRRRPEYYKVVYPNKATFYFDEREFISWDTEPKFFPTQEELYNMVCMFVLDEEKK